MKKIIYKVASPFSHFLGKHPTWIISPLYYRAFHRRIDLNNPVLFHDKIMWMSLNTDTSQWSKLADKYAVREFVEQTIGDSILTKLYGVYGSPDEIDFDALEDQFVLKTNNGCTSNIIVRDKSSLDINDAKSKLRSWMKMPYGELSGQPHYARILPKLIIAEELLIQPECPKEGLIDYKFNCFSGKPVSVAAFSDRKDGTHMISRMLYDMDWNPHPEWYDTAKPVVFKDVPKPVCFDEMAQIASKLSQGFPYVRVDLYAINEKPIFGELTFTPGFDAFYSLEYQKTLGEMIQLPRACKESNIYEKGID